MATTLDDLRAFSTSDEDFSYLCAVVLAVVDEREQGSELLGFNEVDVTVDADSGRVTFQSVLYDEPALPLAIEQFVELVREVAEPWDAQQLAGWRLDRERRVWPMPPD